MVRATVRSWSRSLTAWILRSSPRRAEFHFQGDGDPFRQPVLVSPTSAHSTVRNCSGWLGARHDNVPVRPVVLIDTVLVNVEPVRGVHETG